MRKKLNKKRKRRAKSITHKQAQKIAKKKRAKTPLTKQENIDFIKYLQNKFSYKEDQLIQSLIFQIANNTIHKQDMNQLTAILEFRFNPRIQRLRQRELNGPITVSEQHRLNAFRKYPLHPEAQDLEEKRLGIIPLTQQEEKKLAFYELYKC